MDRWLGDCNPLFAIVLCAIADLDVECSLVRRIFEYWHLFVARVDPMVKVVHCPAFAKKLFGVIDNIGNVSPSTNALLFGIYYTALSSCTAREVRQRFGESREELMQRYGRYFESAIGHSFDVPSLESLQALILYMVSGRRPSESDCTGRHSNTLRLLSHRFRISDMEEPASSTCSTWPSARHKQYG